jgi:thiol-disulfide isomerase/thioredoxin
LFFWSSTCTHCQQGTEVLKNLYKKYQKQKLEVYAVSLDKEENNWKNYLKKQNITWYNVWEKEGWKSKTVEDYVISRTPTIYIINSNSKIVANGLYYSELANWLENYFNTAQLKK